MRWCKYLFINLLDRSVIKFTFHGVIYSIWDDSTRFDPIPRLSICLLVSFVDDFVLFVDRDGTLSLFQLVLLMPSQRSM